MRTTAKYIIPIYDVKLAVYVFDKWEEIQSALPEEERDVQSKGITWTNNNDFFLISVAIDSRYRLSAVHEAEHIKNMIWDYIGYTPQSGNDEVDAYLIKYVYSLIKKVIEKHMATKN